MIRWGLTFLLQLGLAAPLLAQGGMVMPPAPLDAEHAKVRTVLVALRDSLLTVDQAAGRMQRDYQRTSLRSLESRARVMREACVRSRSAVAPARLAVSEARFGAAARTQLLTEFTRLEQELTRCETVFTAYGKRGAGEKVRGYGNAKSRVTLAAIRRYEARLDRYLAAVGIEIRPAGAGPSPLAG